MATIGANGDFTFHLDMFDGKTGECHKRAIEMYAKAGMLNKAHSSVTILVDLTKIPSGRYNVSYGSAAFRVVSCLMALRDCCRAVTLHVNYGATPHKFDFFEHLNRRMEENAWTPSYAIDLIVRGDNILPGVIRFLHLTQCDTASITDLPYEWIHPAVDAFAGKQFLKSVDKLGDQSSEFSDQLTNCELVSFKAQGSLTFACDRSLRKEVERVQEFDISTDIRDVAGALKFHVVFTRCKTVTPADLARIAQRESTDPRHGSLCTVANDGVVSMMLKLTWLASDSPM